MLWYSIDDVIEKESFKRYQKKKEKLIKAGQLTPDKRGLYHTTLCSNNFKINQPPSIPLYCIKNKTMFVFWVPIQCLIVMIQYY